MHHLPTNIIVTFERDVVNNVQILYITIEKIVIVMEYICN